MQPIVDIYFMKIVRINTYQDPRFPQEALDQHGCFLVDGSPCWLLIQPPRRAVIHGCPMAAYDALIEEFRFYAPHITEFRGEEGNLIRSFPAQPWQKIKLSDIQPSQFYVDRDKIAAVSTFIHTWEDIVIQVTPQEGRYISLDGHTRLYYAAMMGWPEVYAVEEPDADYIFGFVREAVSRNIRTPYDMILVDHREYEEKWNKFCDDYFARQEEHNENHSL